jgi:Na+:H+ antiporter, NhaA family
VGSSDGTDIAFAVGVLAVVGRAVPTSVKVFLLAVAIVDDLGAVLVIALFYTTDISLPALAAAGVVFLGLVLLNVLRVHRPLPYTLLGVGLWAATLASGVHATVAGVLLAFAIPATRQIEEQPYVQYVQRMLARFQRDVTTTPDHITEDQSHALKAMEELSQGVQTPLARFEHVRLAQVTFVIVPLFALANAGVNLRGGGGGGDSALPLWSLTLWGVMLGLLVGKPIGILLASWAAVKIGIASLPGGGTWTQMVGVAILSGIGFTMSLFIANLAFAGRDDQLVATKLGILAASLLSGLGGGMVVALAGSRGGSHARR